MTVTNAQELDLMVERVAKAQAEYATFSQAQVDNIFRAKTTLPLSTFITNTKMKKPAEFYLKTSPSALSPLLNLWVSFVA